MAKNQEMRLGSLGLKGIHSRRDTPWSFTVSSLTLTEGANSPRITPSIMDNSIKGDNNLSRMFSSSKGSANSMNQRYEDNELHTYLAAAEDLCCFDL